MNGLPVAFASNLHWGRKTVVFPFCVSFMVRLYDQEEFNPELKFYNATQISNTAAHPLLLWGLVNIKFISGQWQASKKWLNAKRSAWYKNTFQFIQAVKMNFRKGVLGFVLLRRSMQMNVNWPAD